MTHACALPVITFDIHNLYHCQVKQTGALGTKFIKMEEKHLFWKCQLIPCNWGKNLSPFFTVYNFTQFQLQNIRCTNFCLFIVNLSFAHFDICNETWLMIDYVHTTILKLTTPAGLLETIPQIHYITHVQDGLFPFQLCWHQFLTDICNFYQKIPKTNLFDHWCFHAWACIRSWRALFCTFLIAVNTLCPVAGK